MAASFVSRRYVSAVYEDKYFPEKNAAIPFNWETSPGKPKYDDDGDEDDDDYECNRSYTSNIQKDNRQCLQESLAHTSHVPGHVAHVHDTSHVPGHVRATSIYPLRPPPKVPPARPLHVKDLLLHEGSVCDHALSNDPFDDGDPCPLRAYPHGSFSRLSIRFRPHKASTVVPICKNRCVMKQSGNPGVDKSQASSLLVSHAPALQGRSQSFNHAAMHGAGAAAKRAANGSDVVADASMHAPGRRCNSFNSHSSTHHSAVHHDNTDQNVDDDDTSSMAAAAVWAGACILAATAAHDVVSTDHHQHGSCRVAMKLRDLMQQSTNFSELELPTMMKLKKGGGNVINENFAQLALCHATITPTAKRKTEEEATEAFLREGARKSCTHDNDDDVEDEPMKEKVTQEGDHQPGKLVKRKSYLKAFKNECIACWCPSPTL